MTEWFHRNPLKLSFGMFFEKELLGVANSEAAQKICRELQSAFWPLYNAMACPNLQADVVVSRLNTYLGLLHGFVVSLEEGGGESKLRHTLQFRWSIRNETSVMKKDAVYEQIGVLFNMALWYMSRAAYVAGNKDPKFEEALEVHMSLQLAAGVFAFIKKELIGQLKEQPTLKGTDLDANILDAYVYQCTAEAEEVSISRAIELKRDSTIISSLALGTAKLYRMADAALTAVFGWSRQKWQKYLEFKAETYYAYAYNYHGETLLAQGKCGEAIKCLQESQSHYDNAMRVVMEYASTKSEGKTAKPQDHLFFTRLAPIIQETLEKCVHENEFTYHQKVPTTTPDLGEKVVFGVATPEKFRMPPSHPLWTVDTYRSFDMKRLIAEKNLKERCLARLFSIVV